MVGVRSVHPWDFDIADGTSTSIGKKQLLWLVAALSVDTRDHCIWHQDNIPTTPNNFLSCDDRNKFESALQVSSGPKRNGAFCSRVLAVAKIISLMHLTVLSDLEAQVFFVIKDLTRHDGFWPQSIRNSTLRWEEIKQYTVWNTMCIVDNLGI